MTREGKMEAFYKWWHSSERPSWTMDGPEEFARSAFEEGVSSASPDALRVRLLQLKEQAEATMKHSHGDQLTQQAAIIWTCELILASSSGAGVQITGEQLRDAVVPSFQKAMLGEEPADWIPAAASRLNAALSRQSQPPDCESPAGKTGEATTQRTITPPDLPQIPLSKSVEKGRGGRPDVPHEVVAEKVLKAAANGYEKGLAAGIEKGLEMAVQTADAWGLRQSDSKYGTAATAISKAIYALLRGSAAEERQP